VVRLIAVGGWENIIFIIRGISVLALHLPLELLRAKVYLEHKIILQFSEPVDVLLFLNVLLSNTYALQFFESTCAQGIDLIQASVASLVQLGHDGPVFRTFFVVIRVVFQALGSTSCQFFQQHLLNFCKAAVTHLEIELAT